MSSEVQVFNNGNIGLPVKEVGGQVYFEAEAAAIGLGLTDSKGNKVYVRWARIRNYLDSPQVAKGSWITEPQFYKLAFKASNEVAEKFQDWVAKEVLPAIRKHGSYSAKQAESVDLPRKPVDILRLTVQALDEQNERLDKLEETFEQFKAEEPLSPGEYNYIGKLTGRAVRSFLAVADVNHGVPANREQRSELYRDINTGVLQVTGVRTRANLRKRDFDVVCDYVARWTPSVATRMEMERVADRQEEFDF